jgi:DNA-binding NarL/FixJ family response regulator
LHARHDEVIPYWEGRNLAAEIPDAQFVELDSRNHVLLEHEPAWQQFQQAVLEFTGAGLPSGTASGVATLTHRERQILGLLTAGLSNADIGKRLFISEKTVRNHLSSVYRKMAVGSRAQAIVKAQAGAIRAA